MSESVRFQCPKCGVSNDIPLHHLGKKVRCVGCSDDFLATSENTPCKIRFNCPSCRQSLEAPPIMAGDSIECPACSIKVNVPMLGQARAETKELPPSKVTYYSGEKRARASSKKQPFIPAYGWWIIGGFLLTPVIILVTHFYGILGLFGVLGVLGIIGVIFFSFIHPSAFPWIDSSGKHPKTASEDESTLQPFSVPQDQTRACPFCGEKILASAVKCKHCREFLESRELVAPGQRALTPGIPRCQQCGANMASTVITSGNCSGIVVALIVFCIGVVVFFAIPILGWIIGPMICIGALFMGGNRSKVWKCVSCGSIVNRA